MLQLTFNPGLTLTCFRTTRPRARKNIGIIILYCWFLAEVANQMPAVVRVFEATTQRQTTKTPNCSKGEVGRNIVGLFGKVCLFMNCIVVSFVASTPKRLFSLWNRLFLYYWNPDQAPRLKRIKQFKKLKSLDREVKKPFTLFSIPLSLEARYLYSPNLYFWDWRSRGGRNISFPLIIQNSVKVFNTAWSTSNSGLQKLYDL